MQHPAEQAFPINGPVSNDVVVPFAVEGRDVNGRATRLNGVVHKILTTHDYPEVVSVLLGEALAITALLGSLMKFEGIFTLQAKGDGPISLLVVDFANAPGADGAISIGGTLRGYARYDAEAVAALPAGTHDLSGLMGGGYLAFTVDQGEHSERYQGIVELNGPTLDACARAYFLNSEQIEAEIVTHCARVPRADGWRWLAGSLMIRHLPALGGHHATKAGAKIGDRHDNWNHARALFASLRAHELLDPELPLHDLLYRLYNQDGVRVFSPAHLTDGCRCSRERLEQVIRSFSDEDREAMVEDGKISATCEFCKTEYRFEPSEFAA